MDYILDWLYKVFNTLWDVFKDLFFFWIDLAFQIVLGILAGLTAFIDAVNVTQYITALPPEVTAVLNAIGFGQALGIVLSALTVRLMLQLVPFTRLGS